MSPNPRVPQFGALVISLDFELHWGVRDKRATDGPYRENLLGAREAIPSILELFEEFGIAATWATVGFLFAKNRQERDDFSPSLRPQYKNSKLDPYAEPVGNSEDDDLLHYAPSLIARIARTPKQEVATHTFSHYYCQEPGETREAFAADIAGAVAIGRRYGFDIRSIVFPRNQFRAGYDDILKDAGISCYRGNEPNWMYRPRPRGEETLAVRAPRLIDGYISLSGPKFVRWEEITQSNGMHDVRASMFLRPYSPQRKSLEPIRLRRIARGIHAAARNCGIFHLWWHPHNFGKNIPENVEFLRSVLKVFAEQRQVHGMQSLAMVDVGNLLSGAKTSDQPVTADAHASDSLEKVR
jgi:peptidoglycan/xylan/chitin deacetylase (PgdA/CDA1 family)